MEKEIKKYTKASGSCSKNIKISGYSLHVYTLNSGLIQTKSEAKSSVWQYLKKQQGGQK